MNETSILDIISPIMVGPSSSHTAGAVKIGLLARSIYGEKIDKVKIILYNSYAKTGIGHGTDKGILAGLAGLRADDIKIKDIFDLPEGYNIKYKFEFEESFTRHPNAVDIIFSGKKEMKIAAQSIGGGEVKITNIDNFEVDFDGKYNTVLTAIKDEPGEIFKVIKIIQNNGINIANLNCSRKSRGSLASCSIALDGDLEEDVLNLIKKETNTELLRYIKKLDL